MRPATRVAVGIGAAGVALGIWADVLFRGQPLGLNVALWAFAFVVALTFLLRAAGAPLRQGRRWMLVPLVVFSAAFVWHDAPVLLVANILALAGAFTIGALRRAEHGAHQAPITEYAAGALTAGLSAAAGSVHLLHKDIAWDEAGRTARSERLASVGRGIALGLPLLALFGGLFMAADAAFKSLITGAIPPLDHPLEHLVVVLGVAWLTAGLLRDLLAAREDERLLSPAAVAAHPVRVSLGATEIGIALGALNLLFLGFVLVQLRYLFGGQALVEARTHLTYAEYARHGFFELLAVTGLVVVVLLVADALVRKAAPRGVLLVRLLSIGLVGLVFVVMASALERMRLYEHVYGLTELRVYAVGVILWLGVVLLWFAATVLRGRRDLFAVGAVVAGFAATVVLNVVNPDALIARTNLDRPRVDVAYVGGLGDDAVPVLLDRLPSLRPELRRALALELLDRSADQGDWRSYNLSRGRASALLTERHAELLRLSR